jgi:hypothetical protein
MGWRGEEPPAVHPCVPGTFENERCADPGLPQPLNRHGVVRRVAASALALHLVGAYLSLVLMAQPPGSVFVEIRYNAGTTRVKHAAAPPHPPNGFAAVVWYTQWWC